jgi:hypothetical protein
MPEPLLDKLARLKIIKATFAIIQACDKKSDRCAQCVIRAFWTIVNVIRKEMVLRVILIAGACLCLVIGVKWIAEDIVYHVETDETLIIINGLAFVPLIAMAPRYKKGGIVIYGFIGTLEALIILMGLSLTLR